LVQFTVGHYQNREQITHLVRKGRKQEYLNGIDLDIYDIRENQSVVTISKDLSKAVEGSSEPETYVTKYYPKLIEDISDKDDYELIMIPTRHYQLIETIKGLKEKNVSGTYLFFTNNWEGTDEIDNLVPRSKYLWGYASSVGGFINNKMILNISKNYRFGLIEGNDESKFQAVINLFKRAGFEPDEQKNMIHWLWLHHAQIASVVGSTLYSGGIAELLESYENSNLMFRAVREAFMIVQKRGVNLDEYPADTALYLNCSLDEVRSKLKTYFTETKWGKRSSEQSHLNTNPRDQKLILQDVYNTGRKLKLNIPCLDILQAKLLMD
jgi:ketopantoate reductase